MPQLTAQSLTDFQTTVVYVMTDEYRNLLNSENLYWPRLVDLHSGGGRTHIKEWNWATANLHRLGPGGADTKTDNVIPQRQELENAYFGTGLVLTRREWEDDEIDRAAPWSAGAGSLMAYAPQAFLDSIINNGEATANEFFDEPIVTWEGLPLFSQTHTIGGNNTGTFSNLHPGMPFNESNLAKGIAYIEGLRNSGGLVNYNRPRQLVVGSNFRLRSGQITRAEFFQDTLRTAAGANAASNMFSTEVFDFDVPIVSPTINSGDADGAWYLAVPIEGRAFGGPVQLWEREAFALRSFNPQDDWTLQQSQQLVWRLQGRWGAAAGDPMQIHKFKATGVPEPEIAAIPL